MCGTCWCVCGVCGVSGVCGVCVCVTICIINKSLKKNCLLMSLDFQFKASKVKFIHKEMTTVVLAMAFLLMCVIGKS